MTNSEQDENEAKRGRLTVTAGDLLPLVLDILGLSGKLKGAGSSPLPEEVRSFLLVAACMGIVEYFEKEVVDSETQLAPAREMAPIIASRLRQFSTTLPPAPSKN